jgi:hypothetical protein
VTRHGVGLRVGARARVRLGRSIQRRLPG